MLINKYENEEAVFYFIKKGILFGRTKCFVKVRGVNFIAKVKGFELIKVNLCLKYLKECKKKGRTNSKTYYESKEVLNESLRYYKNATLNNTSAEKNNSEK